MSPIVSNVLTWYLGDMTNKYYVVDGVEALQKFGQDAWRVDRVDLASRLIGLEGTESSVFLRLVKHGSSSHTSGRIPRSSFDMVRSSLPG